jgi:hypothetical protein
VWHFAECHTLQSLRWVFSRLCRVLQILSKEVVSGSDCRSWCCLLMLKLVSAKIYLSHPLKCYFLVCSTLYCIFLMSWLVFFSLWILNIDMFTVWIFVVCNGYVYTVLSRYKCNCFSTYASYNQLIWMLLAHVFYSFICSGKTIWSIVFHMIHYVTITTQKPFDQLYFICFTTSHHNSKTIWSIICSTHFWALVTHHKAMKK